MGNPFENEELRDWFFEGIEASDMFPSGMVTLGSDPFGEIEFLEFLEGLGIEVYDPGADLDVLVVGRTGWEEYLHDAIDIRRGKHPRVYSQEMILAYIQANVDPLESPKVAQTFGEGHPALDYIREWGFEWPVTRLVPGLPTSGSLPTRGWRDQSILKLLGYTAGARGQDRRRRQNSLRQAYLNDLRGLAEDEYLAEWGYPQSGRRLQKIAERLSLNITTNISRDSQREAVDHWREDLGWLKHRYYDGNHTFPWPSPKVN